ncbi:CAD17 protein, partial [Atractosteus spatula]|nr:CAD17 protein [Atractosteus spatula]
MQVKATDLDDPTAANAELHYSLINQSPSAPSSSMFSIDAQTGSVSLTAEGASSLDPEVCHQNNLTATVKDMNGKPTAYFSTGIVMKDVIAKTWTSLEPVHLQENLPGPSPKQISQAQWSGSQVEYALERDFPELLFVISRDGLIYLKSPLDRKAQAEFQIEVFVENSNGKVIAKPLELLVNKPTFSQPECHAVTKELTTKDYSKNGVNCHCYANDDSTVYLCLKSDIKIQFNETGAGASCRVSGDTSRNVGPFAQEIRGNVVLEANDCCDLNDVRVIGSFYGSPEYDLFYIYCVFHTVYVKLAFLLQYGPFLIPEDTKVDVQIRTVVVSDRDKPGTDSWFVVHAAEVENQCELFNLYIDQHVLSSVTSLQERDFELVQEYTLVLRAQNTAALSGAESTATVSVRVGNVNEAPILSQSSYVVTVKEEEQPSCILFTVEGSDPDSTYKYSVNTYFLKGDSKKYFTINKDSGEIRGLHVLDKEVDSTYTVEAVEEDGDTHATLPMQNSYLAPGICMVPIIISDSVTVCQCNVRWNCRMAVKELSRMPTVQSAVGTLLGTLGVLGKYLLLISFFQLSQSIFKMAFKIHLATLFVWVQHLDIRCHKHRQK